PICAAAGIANLKVLDRERLVDNAREVGGQFLRLLREALADHPIVGDVRGAGLLAAVEFVADRESRRFFDPALKVGAQVASACLARGLIARPMPQGDILGFAPPLCLTKDDAKRIVEITSDAVSETALKLGKETAQS